MLARILLIAALLIGFALLIRWLRRSPWAVWIGRMLLAGGVAGFLLWLSVRGGAEVALPLLAGLTPLLLRWLKAGRPASITADPPAQSSVTTRFFNMTLEHATGAMNGEILQGRFAGRVLSTLTPQELQALWRECQTDSPSVAVLEAYLDRQAAPDWRETWRDAEAAHSTTADRIISDAEARQILGVAAEATPAEIQAAYRRLIQRLHPDHGGSAYLAAQLNQARDVLLRDSERR